MTSKKNKENTEERHMRVCLEEKGFKVQRIPQSGDKEWTTADLIKKLD